MRPRSGGARGFTGRSGYHYLYVGNDRHAQGRDADAWQHGVESQLFAGGISGAAWAMSAFHFFHSPMSRRGTWISPCSIVESRWHTWPW